MHRDAPLFEKEEDSAHHALCVAAEPVLVVCHEPVALVYIEYQGEPPVQSQRKNIKSGAIDRPIGQRAAVVQGPP